MMRSNSAKRCLGNKNMSVGEYLYYNGLRQKEIKKYVSGFVCFVDTGEGGRESPTFKRPSRDLGLSVFAVMS